MYTRRGDFTKAKWKEWHKASDVMFTEKGVEYILKNELKVNLLKYFMRRFTIGKIKYFILKMKKNF